MNEILVRASRLLVPPYELHRDSLNTKRESESNLKRPFPPFIFAFAHFHQRLNSPVAQEHGKEGNSFRDCKLTTDTATHA